MAGMMIMKRFQHFLQQYHMLPYVVVLLGFALCVHGHQYLRPVELASQSGHLAVHSHESSGKHIHHADHVYDHLRHYEQLVNRLLLLKPVAMASVRCISTYYFLRVSDIFKPPKNSTHPVF